MSLETVLALTVLGYFGPETMMPLASIAAAIGGGFLMFGRRSWFYCRKLAGTLLQFLGAKRSS